MELTYVDFLITKAEEQADGTVIVKGPCTTDDIDSDRQVVDPDFAARGLQKWFATGANIREMHQAKAIGAGISLDREGNTHILGAHIIEPGAAKLATHKVLRAFSVGISGAKLDFTKNPKARGGTIVDGEFVEVSLVDRPANSKCKVDLVTKAENGDAVFTDTILKAEVDVEKAMDTVGGEHVDRDSLDESDFAGPGRSFPITNQKSVEAAWHLAETGHGDDPTAIKEKIKEIAARKGLDVPTDDAAKAIDTEMVNLFMPELVKGVIPPDDQTVTDVLDDAMTKSDDTPLPIRRLHDHICAAFDAESVKAEYPSVEKIGDVIDPQFFARAVTAALTDDGGSGKNASALPGLSAAYGMAVDLVKTDEEVLAEAQDALHKMFSDAYPSVHLTPGSIAAGEFKRPYISAGRANQISNGMSPRMPMSANVPDAAQFDRGPLTAGQQAPSPSAGSPNSPTSMKASDVIIDERETDGGVIVKAIHTPSGIAFEGDPGEEFDSVWKALRAEVNKGRTFYTNNSRDQAAEVMTQMHDYIASSHPGICPMSTKAEDEMEPSPIGDKKVDNEDDSAPKDVKPLDTTTKGLVGADVQKAIDLAVATVRADIEKVYVEKVEKLEAELAETIEERNDLAKRADPAEGPFRSGRGAVRSITKSPDDTTDVDAAEQAEVEKRESVEWLVRKLHEAPDMATKSQTMAKLEEIATPDEIAAALVTA